MVRRYTVRWREVVEREATVEGDSIAQVMEDFQKSGFDGQANSRKVIDRRVEAVRPSSVKFLSTDCLNRLQEDFLSGGTSIGDFRLFVEGRDECVSLDGIADFFEEGVADSIRFLKDSDDLDVRLCGRKHLERVNILRRLLGDKGGLSMEDIRGGAREPSGEHPCGEDSDSDYCKGGDLR
jgi:hypothetical protein